MVGAGGQQPFRVARPDVASGARPITVMPAETRARTPVGLSSITTVRAGSARLSSHGRLRGTVTAAHVLLRREPRNTAFGGVSGAMHRERSAFRRDG